MDRSDILTRLKENEAELRRRGVTHVALFGSVARGDARPESDIDLMVDLDPAERIGVYQYVAIVHYLQDLFPGRVDVADHAALKSQVKPAVEHDAVYAF